MNTIKQIKINELHQLVDLFITLRNKYKLNQFKSLFLRKIHLFFNHDLLIVQNINEEDLSLFGDLLLFPNTTKDNSLKLSSIFNKKDSKEQILHNIEKLYIVLNTENTTTTIEKINELYTIINQEPINTKTTISLFIQGSKQSIIKTINQLLKEDFSNLSFKKNNVILSNNRLSLSSLTINIDELLNYF